MPEMKISNYTVKLWKTEKMAGKCYYYSEHLPANSAVKIYIGTKCDSGKYVHRALLDAKFKQLSTEMFNH